MKTYIILFAIIFLGSCDSDIEFEDGSIEQVENLKSIAASAVTCDNPLIGPSSVSAGTDRSYSVTPKIPSTNPSSFVWSVNTSTMTIVSGQGTRNVVVRFSSAFNGGKLAVSPNGGPCKTEQTISKASGDCANNCGKIYSGNYNVVSSHHYYPDGVMDLNCIPSGARIRLQVSSDDVPNFFLIRDQNNMEVTNSGWRGYTTQSGPWGQSLNNAATFYMTFTKGSSRYYKLQVRTVTPPNQYDNWSATLMCQ
ncbi:MAG: hypothetical protein WBG48_10110 [Pricia sp.]